MFYVYVLKSLKRNYIYVGLTNSVDRRFNEHQTEKNKTTKPYSPFKIILIEQFELRSDARKREKYLKSGIGKQYLKALH
jgi:putative endonuclease